VIVTFLAVLELIRLKQLRIEQPEAFAEIEISPALPAPPPLPGSASAAPTNQTEKTDILTESTPA